MFLSNEFVVKKLEAAKRKAMPEIISSIARYQKDLKDCPDSYWAPKAIAKLQNKLKGYRALRGLPYRPRSGEFYNTNADFDPKTGLAHSYKWYQLGKVMNGQYVVNSYHYSQSTRDHVYGLCATLRILGVKFIELESPQGLQNLESSRDLYLSRIGDATVGMKYGAEKYKKCRMRAIKEATKMLAMLATFGCKHKKADIDQAIANAEATRKNRLEAKAKDRDRVTLLEYSTALRQKDLRGIVKFHRINKKRMDKGLPELKLETKEV